MSKNTYSLSAAARIIGITRDTLRSHIKKKSISTQQDINGNRRIEASELMRVYGNDLDFDAEKQRSSKNQKEAKAAKPDTKALQDRLDLEQRARKEERERHDAQVEELLKALAKSQENHNQTLLLQDHSNVAGDWQQALNDLRTQIGDEQERSRSEIQKMKDEAKNREDRLRLALKSERNKPWWQKIME